MKVYVSKSKVTLQDGYIINRNEYKANTLEFEFSDEYTDDLVKKAIFVNGDTKIEVAILNDTCDIPYEVLDKEQFELRVYAYEIASSELVLRYSPTYANVFTREGSYIEDAEQGEVITPTQFEEYMQAMNDGLIAVNRINVDAEKIGKIATITIVNKDGETEIVHIYDGNDGANGVNGKDGKDGKDGADGKDGKDGKDGTQGEQGIPGQDGHTPIKGVDYWTSQDKQEIVNDVLSQIQDSEEVEY